MIREVTLQRISKLVCLGAIEKWTLESLSKEKKEGRVNINQEKKRKRKEKRKKRKKKKKGRKKKNYKENEKQKNEKREKRATCGVLATTIVGSPFPKS
jgi:hypothetical protein